MSKILLQDSNRKQYFHNDKFEDCMFVVLDKSGKHGLMMKSIDCFGKKCKKFRQRMAIQLDKVTSSNFEDFGVRIACNLTRMSLMEATVQLNC
jgi:hypothetical protein